MKGRTAVSTQKTKDPFVAKPLTPLLSVPEAATLLGIRVPTLRQWLSQRRLSYIKVGRRTMLRLRDIESFIERNRKEAQSFDGR